MSSMRQVLQAETPCGGPHITVPSAVRGIAQLLQVETPCGGQNDMIPTTVHGIAGGVM